MQIGLQTGVRLVLSIFIVTTISENIPTPCAAIVNV